MILLNAFSLVKIFVIQQVDEMYTKALHPHGTLNRKNNHRSKPNLNKQQQQQLSSIADTGNVNWVQDKINNNIGIKSKSNHSQHQIGMVKRNIYVQYLQNIYFLCFVIYSNHFPLNI